MGVNITHLMTVPFKPCPSPMSDLFLVNFCHVVKNILKKEYSVTNSFFKNMKFQESILRNKIHQKSSLLLTTWQGIVQIFLLAYIEYCQIWLNILMNDCHLSNITKLEKKHTAFSMNGNVQAPRNHLQELMPFKVYIILNRSWVMKI